MAPPRSAGLRHDRVAAGGLETADRRQECDRLKTVKLAVDANGSPITLQAQSWLVCFVPGLKKQWWHPFVHKRHKHVFVMRPAGPGAWTLFEPWWHRILVATITSEQARKFPLWGARGDVLLVREAIPGRGSQMRGWMNCAALASYLLGRTYWVWAPHGLYKHLLHEPNVCRVDVSTLLELDAANKLAAGSRVVAPCDECRPGMPNRCEGAAKPFCMNCGRDLEADESVSTNGWFPPARVRSWVRVHEAAGRDVRSR